MALVTLAIRPQSWYVIGGKKRKNEDGKRKKPSPLIAISLFVILDIETAHSHNQLHAVATPNIWH